MSKVNAGETKIFGFCSDELDLEITLLWFRGMLSCCFKIDAALFTLLFTEKLVLGTGFGVEHVLSMQYLDCRSADVRSS